MTIDQIRQQHDRAQTITTRLEAEAAVLRQADKTRRAAMTTIGEQLRAAQQLDADRKALDDPRLGARIEITEAAAITGLSRPTLYQLRTEVPPNAGGDVAALSNAALAQMHAGYGYGGDEQVDAEFWARYPRLAGWHAAIGYLHEEQVADCEDFFEIEARQRAQGPPAGADVLRAEYRRAVDRIAGGS